MKNLIIVSILFLISIQLLSQEKRPVFIGLQPGITKEQFYERDEFDINVIPLVFQIPLSQRLDFRFVTIANYHFGTTNAFSDIGFQSIFPFYFKKKETTNSLSSGFYAGPVLGAGRNLINDHYTTTLALEPGYMFKTSKRFSLTLGLQLGASYFNYDYQPNKWVSHFGVKINLGLWVNKGK